jgi:hypothetical protein
VEAGEPVLPTEPALPAEPVCEEGDAGGEGNAVPEGDPVEDGEEVGDGMEVGDGIDVGEGIDVGDGIEVGDGLGGAGMEGAGLPAEPLVVSQAHSSTVTAAATPLRRSWFTVRLRLPCRKGSCAAGRPCGCRRHPARGR